MVALWLIVWILALVGLALLDVTKRLDFIRPWWLFFYLSAALNLPLLGYLFIPGRRLRTV